MRPLCQCRRGINRRRLSSRATDSPLQRGRGFSWQITRGLHKLEAPERVYFSSQTPTLVILHWNPVGEPVSTVRLMLPERM